MEEKDSVDRSNRGSEDNSKALSNGGDDVRSGKVEELAGERQVSGNLSSVCAVDNSSSGEIKRVPKSETLASVQITGGDFSESSSVLSEVPVEYSLQPLESVEETKDQECHEESLKAVTDKSTQVQIQKQIHVPSYQPKVELSPICVTQSISSISSPVPPEQNSQSIGSGKNMCLSEQDKQNSPGPKSLCGVPMPKTPSDGYNWRKYGQKQVKSPEGSRSYYRCTFSHCQAKKIECSDRFNSTLETVYRSQHNHEPPQKVNSTRENRSALPTVPINGNDNPTRPEAGVNDPVHSATSKKPVRAIDQMLEAKQQESSDSDETMEMDLKEEYVDGPESRRRQKRNSSAEVGSVPKTGKKAKFVVQAAGDVGISGDGYRWRKYGQKMVKGNPHPRNYYRCTSAGCPVRKHIEKAVDNTSTVVITYKGVHDHDTPVPKKRNGPKNSLLVASSPVSSVNLQTDKTEKNNSQTQWSVGKEGELTGQALSADGEKTSESTRSLLSIGFEIKPC